MPCTREAAPATAMVSCCHNAEDKRASATMPAWELEKDAEPLTVGMQQTRKHQSRAPVPLSDPLPPHRRNHTLDEQVWEHLQQDTRSRSYSCATKPLGTIAMMQPRDAINQQCCRHL